MGLFSKKKVEKEEQEEINYLDLTPFCVHKHEYNKDGLIDVLVPRFKSIIARKIFIPKDKSPFVKANFDEVGTATWELIDGKRKVDDIILLLDKKFGENIHPVYDRVTMFLAQMHTNGFISFIEFQKENKNG